VNPITGIATFSRDDGTDFDVDFSGLLGDSQHSHHNKAELDKIQDGDVDKWNNIPDQQKLTQAEYDALGTPDANTIYFIEEE
jgi:hypothetical protein